MTHKNALIGKMVLERQDPTDEIAIDFEGYKEIREFRDRIVGDDVNMMSDIIWSNTVPLTDFVVSVHGKTIRYCFIEETLNTIDEIPPGETCLVGIIQEQGTYGYWLLGVTQGHMDMAFSDEYFDRDGNAHETEVITDEQMSTLCRLWHGIQLMLLHPKTQELFSNGKTSKQHRKVKDENGNKKRRTYYIKRHYINGEEVKRNLKEFNRHCKAWYVVGHWRHNKNGTVSYVRGHWKGELRALKRNIDEGRERKVV